MPNAHWQENLYKDVIKDDGKNGDNTIIERCIFYIGFFYISRNSCHLYPRIENML